MTDSTPRTPSDKKFRRASRRVDEARSFEHPADTRYQGWVDFHNNENHRNEAEIQTRTQLADENPYDALNIKQKKAAKSKSQRAKAQKMAEELQKAPRHLSEEPETPKNETAKRNTKPKHVAPAPHAAGYKAPVSDPYEDLPEQEGGAQQTSAQRIGYQSASEKIKTKNQAGANKKRTVLKAVAIIVGVFLGVGLLGLVAWLNRSVTFTLNGEEESARAGTPITTIMAEEHLSYRAGNLVSVSGNVLKEGEGNPFSLKLNGQDLPFDEAEKLCVFGEEAIELGDGGNIMEPYTSVIQEQEPHLVMEGTGGSVGYVSQWPSPGKIEMRTGDMSGETAPGETVVPLKNAIVTNKLITPANGEKLVALTFDDGPSEYTEQYLQILAQYQAHATFCELYGNIDTYPDVPRAVIAAGHQIISHTKTHSQLDTLTPADLQAELSDTFAKIQSATSQKTTAIRPPYGTIDESVWLNSRGLMSLSVLWTQDSRDWERPGASSIVSNALSGIEPGSIILMHDGGGNRDQDLEALPQILQTLTAQGYKCVTLKELLASDSSIPEEIATCAASMPDGCTWPSSIGD